MNLPQNSSDRSNSCVFLCRKSRSALRLGIYPHRPELDDLKHPSILGQPFLPVKNRSPVIQLHTKSNQYKQRRQNNRKGQTYHNIQQPFYELLLRGESPVAHQKKRRVEHVDLLRSHQHNIRDLRTAVAAHPLFKAVLD